MNILVLSWRGSKHPLSGGAEQVMHEHMKGWAEVGHKVTLFTSDFENADREEIVDEIKIIRLGSQYLSVHLLAFIWYFFGKHEKFNVVVDQFHGWPFFTPLYIRVPKLAVIQELTRKVWFRYPLPLGLNYILGALGYILEPLFFLFYRNVKFMTGSESAKNELQTVGIKNENITVVPHGVIIKIPKKLPQKEKTATIIFLGALASDKGIEDAIKVFSILNEKGEYQYWVVGRGEESYLRYLKNLANKLGISKALTFFGFVSQEKKFELLARAHVMVNPSIREGWGLVNIEANTMGTPVIGYNSMGLIDSINNGLSGSLCKDNTPADMAKEVLKILNDRKYYNILQKGAIEWSQNFSWAKSRRLSLKLIENLQSP